MHIRDYLEIHCGRASSRNIEGEKTPGNPAEGMIANLENTGFGLSLT
jgi:hypothetical protein